MFDWYYHFHFSIYPNSNMTNRFKSAIAFISEVVIFEFIIMSTLLSVDDVKSP